MRLNRSALLLAGFSFFWSIAETVVPASGVSLYQIVWSRYAVHLAVLVLLFAPRRGVPALVRTPRPGWQILRSLLMLGMPLCFIFGVRMLRPGNMLGIFWIAPFMIVALAAFSRASFGGVRTLVAAGTGLVGVWLVLRPDSDALTPAALLPIGMAFCFALYIHMTAQMRDEAILPKLVHTALWVFLALSLLMPAVWRTPSLAGVGSLVAIGSIGLFGLYLLDRAVDTDRWAALAPVLYLQVVYEVLFRWGLRDMAPGRLGLLGMGLIVLAVLPAFFGREERGSRQDAAPARSA